jgi:hypothetical protein
LRRFEALGFVVGLAGLGALLFFALRSEAKQNEMLPIVSPNPRYFADASGAPVYLTGSHNWADLVDVDTRYPPRPFDFEGYLGMLVRNGHTFIRLWTWEQPKLAEHSGIVHYADPLPWGRTGPGTANDGLPKFDLERFDPRYFERLRARTIAARARGIYVSIMLFEGWELQFSKSPYNWHSHPFNRENNVNGIDGDADGDGKGVEVHTLEDPRVTALQERYVRKVVDTVYDLDNVMFEVANESGGYSTRWQYHIIEVIKRYEKSLDVEHPVGMTFQWIGGTNEALFDSSADWVSTRRPSFIENPPAVHGRKVVLLDTDHLCGVCGDATFIRKAFFRGYNPIYMDPITGDGLFGVKGDVSQYEAVRSAMGETARLARQIDLSAMTPQPALFSTAYGLADRGTTYFGYQPKSGPFSVDLRTAKDTFSARWIDPETGSTVPGRTVVGGRRVTFEAPFEGQAVLLLERS